MDRRLAIGLSVVMLALSLVSVAWAQPNATLDTPFQVRYFSNLATADSFVNITNTGATGGNLCINTYVFSPDEQLEACCSCVVTPNGLVSFSVRNDLISNTLTPAVPTSVVVKLLATTNTVPNSSPTCQTYCSSPNPNPYLASWCQQNCPPTTIACNAATAPATPGALASGLLAWGTTTHLQGAQTSTTETPFAPATASAAEVSRITGLCKFIQTNGSGYGICRSCRFGGQ
jgi:hypothetical protein